MKVGSYDFTKSNKLKESVKFTICRHNSKYNEANKTWTVELPQFFTDNEPDYGHEIWRQKSGGFS